MHPSRHARPSPWIAALLVAVVAVVAVACGSGRATPSVAIPSEGTPTATTPASPVASADTATPAPTDDGTSVLDAKVDIGGGRAIHVLCRGVRQEGVPTIWLEHGLDGSLHNWAAVHQPLQMRTRVCGYDRANLGDSDPSGLTERTVDDLADDLEAAIDAAGIPGPFVLVAHSAGPWVSTVFTSRRPDDVVGLVLIDPRGPRVTAAHEAALPPPSAGEDEVVTDVRGFFADGGFDDNAEHLPFAPSEAIVAGLLEADAPFFGDRPVVVLGADGTIDQLPALPDPILGEWWQIWQDGQRAYAEESTRGTFEVVPGSGHLVMDDRPRAVIDAVTAVLDVTTQR